MTINLADNTPRVSYAVAEGVTQTSFTVSFEFFDDADLNVYVDGTLKTLTTDYTVSGGDGSTGTVSISVTGASGGSSVVITRDIALERTTDFPASGAFQIGSLNTELDRLTAIASDLDDKASRSLQLTDYDTAVSLVLPDVDTRKGKTLAFNATTGAVESGPSISDVQTVSAASADIATLADIEDGTDATDAIQTVAGISSNVTTVAGISANVTTVAGISADVTTVASDTTDIGTVATNISSVNTVATNIADVITVANDLNEAISEVETVANDLNEAVSEIDTVAGSISNVDTVGTNIADVSTVAGISSNVTTVAGISANVTTVAGISGNVTTVAGISSNVSTVAADSTDIGTVATNISNVNTVAGISANVTTVAGISANVTTVATDITNVNTVATNISGVNSFAERYRVASSDPATSLDAGDLVYNTTDNALKYYTGSAWSSIVPGIANVVEDTTPQLGGALDLNSQNITGTGNINITGSVTATSFSGDGSSLTGISAGISNVVEDTTPQLGGTLDANGQIIDMGVNTITDTKVGQWDTAYGWGDHSTAGYLTSETFTEVSQDTTPQLGGNLDTNGNDITFGNSGQAVFGAGSELVVWSNGTNSLIQESGTGSLFIDASNLQLRNTGGSETYFIGTSGGGTQLRYANSEKLSTTSYGIDISGSAVADTQTTNASGATTANFDSYQNFVWTLTGNVTLSNPTTEKTGQTGFFIFIHSGAARTVSLGSDYETAGGAGLTLSSTAGAVDIVPYAVQSSGNILLGTPQLAFS